MKLLGYPHAAWAGLPDRRSPEARGDFTLFFRSEAQARGYFEGQFLLRTHHDITGRCEPVLAYGPGNAKGTPTGEWRVTLYYAPYYIQFRMPRPMNVSVPTPGELGSYHDELQQWEGIVLVGTYDTDHARREYFIRLSCWSHITVRLPFAYARFVDGPGYPHEDPRRIDRRPAPILLPDRPRAVTRSTRAAATTEAWASL